MGCFNSTGQTLHISRPQSKWKLRLDDKAAMSVLSRGPTPGTNTLHTVTLDEALTAMRTRPPPERLNLSGVAHVRINVSAKSDHVITCLEQTNPMSWNVSVNILNFQCLSTTAEHPFGTVDRPNQVSVTMQYSEPPEDPGLLELMSEIGLEDVPAQ